MPPRSRHGDKKPKDNGPPPPPQPSVEEQTRKQCKDKAQFSKALGNAAFTKAEYGVAAAHFSECIALDPTDHVYFSNRSACQLHLNAPEKAETDALECVRRAPEWAKGYCRLGTAQQVLGKNDEAKITLEAGLMLDPTNTGLLEAMKGLSLNSAAPAATPVEEAPKPVVEAPTTLPEDDVVVGIDLGTTFSCVAVWRNGRVEVLANELGERTTPSYVAFPEEGGRLVGEPAKAQASRNPKNTFYNVKRLLGREFSDTREEAARLAYPVSERDGRPTVQATIDGRTSTYNPEEISAMVLEKMKAVAEAALGHPVKRAVITVPAYFNDAQRRSTTTAGTIAGLTVERVINEPTAAALAYGLDTQKSGNVLVFDLGGGTFDVSLLCIEGGMFEVLATAGDTHLGGEDFDGAVQDSLREEFKKQQSGKDVFAEDPAALRKLRTACERAKRLLSTATVAPIEIEVGGVELTTTLTRERFEKLNEKPFERCLQAVKRVMDDAKVPKAKVSEVVLVGGSTRIPKVQQLLMDFFDGKQLCKSVNPDEAVAYGAAVQGAVLAGVRDPKMMQVVLIDVIPLTLGIETEGRVFAKVVPRNSSVPCEKTRDFTTVEDFQTAVDVRVFEGERGCTDGNHLLGEFLITGIERAKRGVPKIDVKFALNVNGLLTVTAKDRATGASADIKINNDRGRHSDADVERMVADAARLREEDDKRIAEQERMSAERDQADYGAEE